MSGYAGSEKLPIPPGVTPSVRRALRAAGTFLILLSFTCLVGSGVPAAPGMIGKVGASINQALDKTVGRLFRRHGTRRAPLGEGPLQVVASGGMDVGLHKQSLAATQTASGASLNLALDRRTDQSALSVQLPLAYSNGQSSMGQIVAGYNTPQYALGYGSVAGPANSQLAVAGFIRGLDVSLPRRRGTIDLLAAVGTFNSGVGYHAVGVRRTLPLNRVGLLEVTALHAFGNGAGQSTNVLDLSLSRNAGRRSEFYEVGYGAGDTGTGMHGGLAWSARIDTGGAAGYTSFYARQMPEDFVTVNGSQATSRLVGATLSRRVAGGGLLTADLAREMSGFSGDLISTVRQTYQFAQPLRFGSVSLIGERAVSVGAGSHILTSSLGVSASQNLRGTTLTETAQRAIGLTDGIATVQSQSGIGVSRDVFHGSVALYASTTHALDGSGASQLNTVVGQYSRVVGRRTQLVLGVQSQSSDLAGVVSQQASASISVVRQIFNGMAIALTDVHTVQHGPGGGSSNSFGLQLTGPLSLGSTMTYGRPNPNLPAAVAGHVLLTDSSAAYGGALNHGAANAVVVLDGTRTQRTDATGGYAFRLVPPGAHTISVEPASLGPGIVVDRQNREVQVAGGQTAAVDFYAGSFAGIGGRVYVHNGDGSSKPLAGVAIKIDKDITTISGPDGRYQVGRLPNGAHTVAIDTATLPATVGMTGSSQRVVQVQQGAVTSVDWSVVGMAVIAGHVMFAPDAGMGEIRGAKDVYVIAQPGEHAAITNEDGSFALADLPPGTYTLSVDPDTMPEELGVIRGADKPYVILGGEQIGGVDFQLGPKAKDVIFSFSDHKKVPLAVHISPEVVPPGGLVRVAVRPQADIGRDTLRIESDLAPPVALRFDGREKAYTGAFVVPGALQPGNYAVRIVLEGQHSGAAEAGFSVDNTMPLVTVRTIPSRPQPGHTIHVVAKILGPVQAGDTVRFEDGYSVLLPEPRGSTFGFDVRLWSRGLPYRAMVVRAGREIIPLVLGASR